jgi:hypothetical protein
MPSSFANVDARPVKSPVSLAVAPELGDMLLPLVIGSTVIFELIGPFKTPLSLVRVGETGDVRS